MKLQKQIIPFPLPPYLASYFANQITARPIALDSVTVKPFSVDRYSSFGKFIYRCLSKTNRPKFETKGYTFFIEISEPTTALDTMTEDARYSFIELKEEEIKEITGVFKTFFDTALFNFVAGARFSFMKFTNKQRGYLKASILEFCNIHGVNYTDQNLMAWEKSINRTLKKRKCLTSNML